MPNATQPRRTKIRLLILFCSTLLFSIPLANCGDVCFSVTGVFNATSTTNPPTCKLATASGTLNLQINSVPASSAVPMSPNLQHVFITLRGIDAHPSALASDDSPDWQQLAPDLENHPMQLDLMAPAAPAPGADSCALGAVRNSRVRADVYRQIRLRLISNPPAASETLPLENKCAGAGFNCAVTNNGQIHALTFTSGTQQLLIAPQQIANGFFNVLPDTQTTLTIIFDPNSSLAAPSGNAVKIVPAFSVAESAACASLTQSE
jgi:hypothetical protein